MTEFMSCQKHAKIHGIPPDLTLQEIVYRNGREVLEDVHITDKKHCRFLGLTMQNNLTWEAHLTSGRKAVWPAVRRTIGMISKLSQHMSMKCKLQLMNSLVLSKLTYMVGVWGNTTPSHMRKAQVVLNLAARVVTGCGKTTRQVDLMRLCSWMNIQELTIYHLLMHMWKGVKWGIPGYLSEVLTMDTDDLIIDHPPRLKITAGAFRHKTVPRWNSLPPHLRAESSIIKF